MGRIEELADQLLKRPPQIKKARIESVPRQAVLKPAHAIYRLRNQRFDIGDRVVMVKDSGSVPLSTRGVVIGINVGSIDVVWDVAFMSGSTLGNRFASHWVEWDNHQLTSLFQVLSVSWCHGRPRFLFESHQLSAARFSELFGTPAIASKCWSTSRGRSMAATPVNVEGTCEQTVRYFVCDFW